MPYSNVEKAEKVCEEITMYFFRGFDYQQETLSDFLKGEASKCLDDAVMCFFGQNHLYAGLLISSFPAASP